MTEESDDKVKLALRLQAMENDIAAINKKIDKADGRWSAAYSIAIKVCLVVTLFLASFWAKAKGLM